MENGNIFRNRKKQHQNSHAHSVEWKIVRMREGESESNGVIYQLNYSEPTEMGVNE